LKRTGLTSAGEKMISAASPFREETESICPVCFTRVPAHRVTKGEEVTMIKDCPDHGHFETILWRGNPGMDAWKRPKGVIHPPVCYARVDLGCPFDCGLCEAHRQLPCSILLEVTERCDLQCPLCFADSGPRKAADPALKTIASWYSRALEAAGSCSIQLSGGEPTLRHDLPAIIGIGRKAGFSFIQLNTNGLRLASERAYAKILKKAGLAAVFLQFDGIDDNVYRSLRGRPLLKEKITAIRNCGDAGLGVVLVPTLVPGVNTDSIGSIVRFALARAPVVRGVHFQPVSYFGRYPAGNGSLERITLPEVMRALEEQTGGIVKTARLGPPGCEHALCSFHGSFVLMRDGSLKSVTGSAGVPCCDAPRRGVERTVSLVSRQWSAPLDGRPPREGGRDTELMDLDTFLDETLRNSFTISCMAFQDSENLDLERLRQCCISVMTPDGRLVPFCAYNLTGAGGRRLYRDGPWKRPL
jgi:7,8-dihydro-6-hydroxymethylpterin dimethyltransferase